VKVALFELLLQIQSWSRVQWGSWTFWQMWAERQMMSGQVWTNMD